MEAKQPIEHITDEQESLDGLVRTVSKEEGMEILDRQARRRLGISGEEFLRKWKAGEFSDDPDQPGLAFVASLIPFVE